MTLRYPNRSHPTHGMKGHLLYSVYEGMMARCFDSSYYNYPRYGGRGITVCQAWAQDRSKFFLWALDAGWERGLQIDRIDNDSGYSPENCRFVSARVNTRNRSTTKLNIQSAAIIKDLADRGVPQKIIGALFDVCFQAVSDIKRGKNWPDAAAYLRGELA